MDLDWRVGLVDIGTILYGLKQSLAGGFHRIELLFIVPWHKLLPC